MPVLHTDDGPRRLRAVWLGPTGATLPFEWTYVQWVATLAAIPVAVGVLWAVGTLVHQLIPGFDDFLIWAIALTWGPAFGVYLTVKVMRHVSFDQPLAARVRLVRTELHPRPRPARTAWAIRTPPITDLARPASLALGWTKPVLFPAVLPPLPTDPKQIVRDYLWSKR